jgi:hypothetical protein
LILQRNTVKNPKGICKSQKTIKVTIQLFLYCTLLYFVIVLSMKRIDKANLKEALDRIDELANELFGDVDIDILTLPNIKDAPNEKSREVSSKNR